MTQLMIFLNERHTAVDDDYCFALSSGNSGRESIDGREAQEVRLSLLLESAGDGGRRFAAQIKRRRILSLQMSSNEGISTVDPFKGLNEEKLTPASSDQ